MSKEREKRVRLTRWELAVLLDGMDAYQKQVKFNDGHENKHVAHIGDFLRSEYNRLHGKLHRAYDGRTF